MRVVDSTVRSAVVMLAGISGAVLGLGMLGPLVSPLGFGDGTPDATAAALGAAAAAAIAIAFTWRWQDPNPVAANIPTAPQDEASPPPSASSSASSSAAPSASSSAAPSPSPSLSEGTVVGNSALLAKVRSPERSFSPLFLLVASFILFSLVGGFGSIERLITVVVVIAIHEAGHALGMKAFGYRDVRVFFVPFFGAAAQGTRNAGPAWREGVVLLLGPVPGLILGVALAIVARGNGSPVLASAADVFIFINGFNLLPVMPLDGGRLFELVLFGRHRLPAACLQGASAFVFVLLAIAERDWVFGLIAYFLIVSIPRSWAVATAAAGTAAMPLPLPDRYEDTTPELLADIDQRLEPRLGSNSVDRRAAWIRRTIDRALCFRHHPGLLASGTLLAAWAGAVLLTSFGVGLLILFGDAGMTGLE